jgi:hypothetical protein
MNGHLLSGRGWVGSHGAMKYASTGSCLRTEVVGRQRVFMNTRMVVVFYIAVTRSRKIEISKQPKIKRGLIKKFQLKVTVISRAVLSLTAA